MMDAPNATSSPIASQVLTEERIQEIKNRVVRAATEGLSQIATNSFGGFSPKSNSSVTNQRCGSAIPSELLSARSRHSTGSSFSNISLSTAAAAHNAPTSQTSSLLLRRSSSVWNFHDRELFPVQKLRYMPGVPIAEQESLVVNELLHCLVGVRGTYIVPIDDHPSVAADNADPNNDGTADDQMAPIAFRVSPQLSESLRTKVQDILPLASDYSCLQRFGQLCGDGGQVQQALSAAVRLLIMDYYVFLVQLESEHLQTTGGLTLAKLLFFVRPTMAVFRTLATLARTIRAQRLHGAHILTHLHDAITTLTGAPAVQAIVVQLTQAAARPYMEMLHLWIHKGLIVDGAHEFLVADNEHIRTDFIHIDHYSAEYWEKRYTIRDECVPSFLRAQADRVLRAGKYLNVIRQCGETQFEEPSTVATTTTATTTAEETAVRACEILTDTAERSTGTTIRFCATDPSVHGTAIEAAYTRAARTLLTVLVTDADLMGHLQSVKRYLLLHQGDFINQFMDAAEKELAKNVDRVQPMRLDNLLGMTLRMASTKYDRYNEDLHCQLFPFELCKQMEKIHLAGSQEEEYWHHDDKINLTGLECFAFRYEVRWPVSLVLNHFAVLEYQMLFRQLFYCKHVERQLCKVWKDNNNANKFAPAAAELYRSAFTLRQRMMSAVQNIEYYMMIEVIEPTWHEFVGKLADVSNVDEVLAVHQDFLDDCLYNCMLKTPSLLRAVTKLCNICLGFCRFIQKAQEHFVDAEISSMLNGSSDSDSDMEPASYPAQSESSMAATETFAERIKRFDLEFTFVLIGLLKQINEISYENPNSKLINLVHRINFNSFYTIQLEQMSCKNAKINLRATANESNV